MDKTLQTRQNFLDKDKKYKNNETNIFYFFSTNRSAFALHTFLINLKLLLK